MKKIGPALVLFTLFIGLAHAEPRTFTSTDGRTIQATVIKVTDANVVLDHPNFGTVTVPLDRLVEGDRKFLAKWAEAEKKNRIPKTEIQINSNKRDRRKEDAYEDRRGEFEFEIHIENEERNFDIAGAKATLIAFGDYMYDPGSCVIMERTEFNKIEIPEGKTRTLTGKLVRFEYDKDGYKHGEKYTGYLFELRTASGKIIVRKGSTQRVINDAEQLLKLRMRDIFDERTYRKLGRASTSSN